MILGALSFVLGVWLLQQQAALPSPYWICLMIPAAGVFFLPPLLRRLFIPLVALSAGFLWAALIAHHRLDDALPLEWEGREVVLIGVVASLPDASERGVRFRFDVERVLTEGARVPWHISLAQGDDAIFGNARAPQSLDFHPGERWQLKVRLKRPRGLSNPDGFDYEAWMLQQNIRATGYIRASADSHRIDAFVMRPGYIVEALRERIRVRMQHLLRDAPAAPVLRALAIGDDGDISLDSWQVFLKTGVNHLISISGLHITMLASLVAGALFAIWRRLPALAVRVPARKAAIVAGAVTALAYALIAGFSVPTQRTLYMLCVFAIALWSGRRVSLARVLAYALLIVTIMDPWAVLAPGFWLSFGAVAVIAYAVGGRLHRLHWLQEAVVTQWAVTLGLIPLLLVMFQQFSLISPVANAVAIPVVSLIVVPLTLLGAIVPVFDWPLHLAAWVMDWCTHLLAWLAGFPLSTWQQHMPSAWTFLVALLGIVWMLLPRGFPMRWLGLFGLLPMFLLKPDVPLPGAMRVTVLDVGQGLAVVVKTADHALLYDAGPRYSAQNDSGNRIVVPYLRAAGIGKLDGFVISHDDLDHSGGALSVIAQMPITQVLASLPPDAREYAQVPHHVRCMSSQSWRWDDVQFDMLAPDPESYQDAAVKDNNRSCVLKVTSRYGSILLPGDIEKTAEDMLVKIASPMLAADVLVAPHHGSKTSSSEGFIQAAHPAVVIYTMGYRNRYRHPHPAIVERYQAMHAKAYRSDENGALIMDFSTPAGIHITPWRQYAKRYWQGA